MRRNRIATRAAGSRGRSAWIVASTVLVVGILAAAFLWLRGGAEAEGAQSASRAVAAADERAESPLALPAPAEESAERAQAVPEPAAGEAHTPRPAPGVDAGPDPTREARTRLVARAIDRASGAPVEDLLLGVHPLVPGSDPFADSEVAQRQLKPWARGLRVQDVVPIEVRVTGEDGRAAFEPPSGVPLRLVTLGEYEGDPLAERALLEADVGPLDRARWPARLDVGPLERGATAAVDFVTETRPRVELSIRVRSDEGPVAGASVVLARRRATAIAGTGTVARSGEQDCGATDETGTVELRATLVPDVHGRVEAAGFGPAFFALPASATASAAPTAIVVRLERSASVTGRLVDALGAPVAAARIEARAHTRRHPWFGGVPRAGDQGGDLDWDARTGLDGRFVLEELPANVPLELSLKYEERTLCDADRPLTLAPGETREVLWTVCAGLTLTGLVLDRDGAPLAERAVWLLQGETTPVGVRYLRGDELEADEVVRAARSDLDGRFELDELVAGVYWLAAAPFEHDGPPVAVPVRVAAEGGEAELRELPALFIRGFVRRAGEACAGAFVVAEPEPGRGAVRARSDAAGAFELGPLAPGSFVLRAELAGEPPVRGPVARANAGDGAIELTLP